MLLTPDLIRWQRAHYGEAHAGRRNLLLHLFTAPLFLLGALALIASPILGSRASAGAGVLGMLIAFIAQAVGHKSESVPPAKFQSPLDLLVRFTVENGFNYWRFLFSGELARAFRAAKRPR